MDDDYDMKEDSHFVAKQLFSGPPRMVFLRQLQYTMRLFPDCSKNVYSTNRCILLISLFDPTVKGVGLLWLKSYIFHFCCIVFLSAFMSADDTSMLRG